MIEKTIAAICEWIQAALRNGQNISEVAEMTKALAELETARAQGVRFYSSTRSASREQITE